MHIFRIAFSNLNIFKIFPSSGIFLKGALIQLNNPLASCFLLNLNFLLYTGHFDKNIIFPFFYNPWVFTFCIFSFLQTICFHLQQWLTAVNSILFSLKSVHLLQHNFIDNILWLNILKNNIIRINTLRII